MISLEDRIRLQPAYSEYLSNALAKKYATSFVRIIDRQSGYKLLENDLEVSPERYHPGWGMPDWEFNGVQKFYLYKKFMIKTFDQWVENQTGLFQ